MTTRTKPALWTISPQQWVQSLKGSYRWTRVICYLLCQPLPCLISFVFGLGTDLAPASQSNLSFSLETIGAQRLLFKKTTSQLSVFEAMRAVDLQAVSPQWLHHLCQSSWTLRAAVQQDNKQLMSLEIIYSIRAVNPSLPVLRRKWSLPNQLGLLKLLFKKTTS